MGFATRLWKNQPGKYFCISTKSLTGKWKDHWFPRSSFRKVDAFIEDNVDKDVYMCPHGFTKKERKKEFSVDPMILYADLDYSKPDVVPIRPTIAIQSSPGRYVGYWITDVEASEELNRRLTYMIGSDVSGWDRTQVLRVPGTRNFKYDNAPAVRILWTNGPTYTVEQLENDVPYIRSLKGEEINDQAAAIFKKYESKLSRWARKELMASEAVKGKRSEVLWKLQNELLETGMTREEAFDLLWVSPWNKFANRRNGADQLWRELDKSLDQHFEGYSATHTEDSDDKRRMLSRNMSEVVAEKMDWVAPGMFARGEITIVEGDPGLGKSYWMQMVSKCICDGERLPCIERPYPAAEGNVAYFDTENSTATVTKPRLTNNGLVRQDRFWQEDMAFSIDEEDMWEQMIEQLQALKPVLVVFDPINLYIGGSDTYRSNEVQYALTKFKQVAVRLSCSVVLLRHLTKGGKDKALYRGIGSIAMTGVARIVMTVGQLPDDPETRVIACTKNNVTKMPKSFTYTIDALPDTIDDDNRSKFTWGDFVDLHADDIVGAINPTKPGESTKDFALKWLEETLTREPGMNGMKIKDAAEARGITKTALYRASDTLGVVKRSKGFGKNKRSAWSLPSHGEPSTSVPPTGQSQRTRRRKK